MTRRGEAEGAWLRIRPFMRVQTAPGRRRSTPSSQRCIAHHPPAPAAKSLTMSPESPVATSVRVTVAGEGRLLAGAAYLDRLIVRAGQRKAVPPFG